MSHAPQYIVYGFLTIVGLYGLFTIWLLFTDHKPKPQTTRPDPTPRPEYLAFDFSPSAIKKRDSIIIGVYDAKLTPFELEFIDFYEAHSLEESVAFVKKTSNYFRKHISFAADIRKGEVSDDPKDLVRVLYNLYRKQYDRSMTEQYDIHYSTRNRHIYLPGKTRSGKSNLIHWMAYQDISAGKGVCVIDPAGDLSERILDHVPEHRIEDTIYLDMTEPIPIDFMGYQGDAERDRLADDLLVTFKRFSEGWGERMESILRHTIMTLLSVEGSTFLDIYYFLANLEHRQKILDQCKNPDLIHYWNEYPKLHPRDAASPITSRMSKFLLTPSLKAMLGTSKPQEGKQLLNIFDCMEQKKVILVNLAKVGQESANLLGTLLVSKIQQGAFRRQGQKLENRVPFYCYVDEFENFQTSAFDVILSQAAKFQLCLTLANQYVEQLDGKIKASLLGNVGTYILFDIRDVDANLFKTEIAPVDPKELVRQDQGRALYRPVHGKPVFIKTPWTQSSPESYAKIIRKRTVDKYAGNVSKDMVQLKQDATPEPEGKSKAFLPHRPKAQGSHKPR